MSHIMSGVSFSRPAGLGFFYGGLVRHTNIINTMMMSVVSMGIVTLTWVVCGFSWAFGENGPVIGNFDYAFFTDLDMKMWGDSGLPGLVFASFQMPGCSWNVFWQRVSDNVWISKQVSRAAEDDVRYHCVSDYLGLLGGAHALQRLRSSADFVAPRRVYLLRFA